jgi:hypothetical protein
MSRSRTDLRLPGGIAVLFGIGAVGTSGAATDVSNTTPQNVATAAVGGVTVRTEDGRIYLSESGRESELRLGPTAERDHLLHLLEPHGPKGVKLHADPRLIMSGAGGAGFSLKDLPKFRSEQPNPGAANSSPTTPQAKPKQETRPQDRGPPADKKG